MNLTKCPNNHYYNADKLPYCPYCINIEAGVSITNLSGLDQAHIGTASTPSYTEETTALQRKTIGWLVCIEGNMRGESFPIYDQKNYIGRGSHMNICLSKEPTVSRENHACIVYEKDTKALLIKPCNTKNIILLNDALLTDTQPLQNRNLIQLGDCVLLFVALCDDNFSW